MDEQKGDKAGEAPAPAKGHAGPASNADTPDTIRGLIKAKAEFEEPFYGPPLPPLDIPTDSSGLVAKERHWLVLWSARNADAIRRAEFGVALTCAVGAWFGGGDMELIIPALIFGFVLSIAGLVPSDSLSVGMKAFWAMLFFVVFVSEGLFLQTHFHGLPWEPSKKEQAREATESKSLDYTIRYECEVDSFPNSVPEDGRITYLEVINPIPQTLGSFPSALYMGMGSRANPNEMNKGFGSSIAKCTITNYSPISITYFLASILYSGATS